MSNTRVKHSDLKPKQKDDNVNDKDIDYSGIIKKYNELYNEYHHLSEKNKVLKELILEKQDNNFQSSLNDKKDVNFHPNRTKRSFYIQIILGLLVIILSLGFHIVYLGVTDCLLYNDGNPDCWIKSWLGIGIHASFYIDLFLYSLIFLQSLLIILIIRSKISEFKLKKR
ncbi:MAG: hypothetical protein ACFFAQ_10955 [Promethearchaeota archaeon]